MIPSIYEYIEPYRKAGRINADCAMRALGITDSEVAKLKASDAHTRYLIDAFVLMQQRIPAYMRAYHAGVEFSDSVKAALIEAESEAVSMGCSVEHAGDEERLVRWYVIHCALQNLNNPKRRGETWNGRMERLLRAENVPAKEWQGIINGLPYYAPKEFLAMPHVDDASLSLCIQCYRNKALETNED